VKLDQQSAYRFDADLSATRYVTLRVNEKGAPLADARSRSPGRRRVSPTPRASWYTSIASSRRRGPSSRSPPGISGHRAIYDFQPGQVIESRSTAKR